MAMQKVQTVRIVGVGKTKGFVGQNIQAQANALRKEGAYVQEIDESSNEMTLRIYPDYLSDDYFPFTDKKERAFEWLDNILSKRIKSYDAKFMVYFENGTHRLILHPRSNQQRKRWPNI